MSNSDTPGLDGDVRRRPHLVFSALLGLTAGAVAMLGLLQLPGVISNNATASTMGSMTPRSALLLHVPQTIRSDCESGDDYQVADFAYYSVICRPPGFITRVQYSTFHDAVALRTLFYQDLQMIGQGSRTPWPCAGGKDFHRWWTNGRENTVSHNLTGKPPRVNGPGSWSDPAMSPTSGWVMCYLRGTDAVVEWFDNDTHIYGWAAGPRDDDPDLFSWWHKHAGPIHPSKSAM